MWLRNLHKDGQRLFCLFPAFFVYKEKRTKWT
nr:MAG TPA: hypothetical protein [Caudoviricetes sp.]